MSAAANCVSIVGYRHEVVHTGLLRYLLNDPAFGAHVAADLTSADVVAVLGARQESKVDGFKGKADLIAELELTSEEMVTMAIETTVDSDGSREQLRATAAPPHYGVLLAVGLTAFKLGQRELEPDLPQWRAVGPRDLETAARRDHRSRGA